MSILAGSIKVFQAEICGTTIKDDPARPVNKVAGEWNNNSGSKLVVADLQASDTTLRITEEITGWLSGISFDLNNGKLFNRSVNGTETVYEEVRE